MPSNPATMFVYNIYNRVINVHFFCFHTSKCACLRPPLKVWALSGTCLAETGKCKLESRVHKEVLLEWANSVCEMRLRGHPHAQYWMEPWEQSGIMAGWVSSVNAEREVSSSLHIDWRWAWCLWWKRYEIYMAAIPWGPLRNSVKNANCRLISDESLQIGSLLENTFGVNVAPAWEKHIDQLVPRYCSFFFFLASKFIKPTALKSLWGNISMFHLQIMISSTYKNFKIVSRELRTTFIPFTIISIYRTPSKLFRLHLREDPKWGRHFGAFSPG